MASNFEYPKLNPDWRPQGFRCAGIYCGIKESKRHDLMLIVSDHPAIGAAMFTTNAFCAAPVLISRPVAEAGKFRAVVCNSGNANACTGPKGLENAKKMQQKAADTLSVAPEEVLVCSTGVIGSHLNMDAILGGIPQVAQSLSDDGWESVVAAMRTTDAFPKYFGATFEIGGKTVRLLGLAKGGGMIHPNMATMLSFLVTDAAIEPDALRQALRDAVNASFNAISVDGDTSTNDTVAIMANGAAGNAPIQLGAPEYKEFCQRLETVCIVLGKLIVHDGEGATRMGIINVRGAESDADALKAALAVARSPLVKTALYGADANWGRIVCALGYSGAKVNPEKTCVSLAGHLIFHDGLPMEVNEARTKAGLEKEEVPIDIDLGTGGEGKATYYTSDLTHEYIQVNAFYRT
ncbi:bifunctional glutamate N-acetyltransferase/amino-acid acetyltransferase ArgJ [Candidatus Sumerlaeota bacterium]|nr:bifunctional glutamate N-acetyltransferase/amino-acid acetyltransferase ArgJ [Candidatus Sumerlaeota bacterium]